MLDSCLPDHLLRSAPDLERYLIDQRSPALAALALPGEFVLPCAGLSVANVPATLAELLGARLASASAPLPDAMWQDLAAGVRRVVCIILDAVGWTELRRLLEDEADLSLSRLARAGRFLPLTAVYPSTTTSALTTIWTGYTPAQHGLVGHMLYLRELGVVGDMLMFSPAGEHRRDQLLERGLDAATFLPVPGLAQALAEQGVTTRVLINMSLAATSYSHMCFRGAAEVGRFITPADMAVQLRQTLQAHRDERLLLAAYLAELDSIGHIEGPGGEAWRAELRSLAYSLEREFLRGLSPEERAGTLVVLVSDHGQMVAPVTSVPLADHPELRRHLLLPITGSLRAAYLFAVQGEAAEARAYLGERLGEQFAVVDSGDAVAAGLLGPGRPARETACRTGDLVVMARDHFMLDYRRRDHPVLGAHAGTSAEEMLVPFLMVRLD